MTRFWLDKLAPRDTLRVSSIHKLDEASREFGIPSVAKVTKKNRLVDVLGVKDRYIVAEFEQGEALLQYSEPLKRFLEALVGHDIRDILSVASKLDIVQLTQKLTEIIKNEKTLLFADEAFSAIGGPANWVNRFLIDFVAKGRLEEIDTGVYVNELVPEGFCAVKNEAIIDDEEAWVFVVGKLSSNFLGYFNSLKE